MEIKIDALRSVLGLVAVINGIGIIRLLNALAELLRKNEFFKIRHYSVYTMLILFQLLIHLLFWWTATGLNSLDNVNFLSYLYVLTGPTLLYFGTTLILPELNKDYCDLKTIYFEYHKAYFTILAAFMLWSIFLWPVLGYSFPPNLPYLTGILIIALILRMTSNPTVHLTLMTINLSVFALIVTLFSMDIGGITGILHHR